MAGRAAGTRAVAAVRAAGRYAREEARLSSRWYERWLYADPLGQRLSGVPDLTERRQIARECRRRANLTAWAAVTLIVILVVGQVLFGWAGRQFRLERVLANFGQPALFAVALGTFFAWERRALLRVLPSVLRAMGRCPRCGYPARTASPRCSECGTELGEGPRPDDQQSERAGHSDAHSAAHDDGRAPPHG